MNVIFMADQALLNKENSVLVIFEMQERLFPAVLSHKEVLQNIINLARSCKVLGVPIILTEQYPKGLGPTIPDLKDALDEGVVPLEKLSFSAFGSESFRDRLKELNAKTLILSGLECHICITQTALAGLSEGFDIHVVSDATSSRTKENYQAGLARIRQAGAVITTTEMVLYEMMKVAKTPEFDEVLKVLR
jgi:nicotinamidase-related amidase